MKKAALFLDRDGVINEDLGYVHKVENFHFIDGIFKLCQYARKAGMMIFVVTNQAGIGRGYYTESQFYALTEWMVSRFSEEGVAIDGVYFCPFHPIHGIGEYKIESLDRKPGAGMILRAAAEHNLDLENSILIGDREWDIAAAQNAGIGTSVLLTDQNNPMPPTPDIVVASLHDAVRLLFPQSVE
ncbi:HAD family hydrolase [Rhizobium sp. Leaf262]|uniref:D-glycero-alpha-D-manno-heptose-1,7-bisphosphate 7-phosphatase n=1 Tax=Rhizobium sp. Leaf262 TaxID=1736312 RepID=UPI00071636F8|nr:HAD family hydrolase [Rhizobium sp. Leaf262]KQO79772.1 D,D-heptose 1,7-bisphosphate phosphatase [Rhizobium sp. Leaf262]